MSIVIPDCYESIVGLTRTDCDCFDNSPDSAADSLSGLYIDELIGMNFVQAATDCAVYDDLFAKMQKARDNAIAIFQADTNALMLRNFRMRRNPFKGGIGRVATNPMTLIAGNYLGARFYCDNVKSGVLHIKSIGALFNQSDVVSLSIYNNLGELLHEIDLNAVAGAHTQNAVSIELPLHSDYVDHLEYFFLYQYDGVIVPKVNDLKCNCGGFKPRFDCSNPYYQSRHDTVYGWADWVMVGGVNSSELPDFTNCSCKSVSNYLFGLTFNVELRCKIGEVLCHEQMDFEGNPLAGAMAIAIQNKSAELLVNSILQSGNLSRFTMINTEQLITDGGNFKATYEQMIKYIVESADITQNDCFACKDVYEMAKRGIFA